MRKWPVYLCAVLVLAAWNWMPFQGTDIARLQPVEVIRISQSGSAVVIETDTGDFGIGATAEEALKNLKDTTSGTVFLETAEYLIAGENGQDLIDAISPFLRPTCKPCVERGNIPLEDAAAFLDSHTPEITLQDRRSGQKELPIITLTEGRMELVQQ